MATGMAPREGAERLIGQMIAQRLLLTNLRPPSTETDPLAHLVGQLWKIAIEGGVVPLIDQLGQIRDLKFLYDSAPDETTAEALLLDLREALVLIQPGYAVGIDLRLDCDLMVLAGVTAEACRAASALTRLASSASAGWREWHARFLDRYGLHALVPILDAVDAQIGLGCPDGFTGEPTDATDRDQRLIALAQGAALRRQHEVILDDAALEELAGAAPTEILPTAELTVRVHANSLQAIANGDFQLSVVRASKQAFSTAGRFLDLFDEATRQRMTSRAAKSPPASTGALEGV
ncbi:lantibiotic dehydratase [Streptomyces sp. NPDC002668]|uniref:lantibiotic dehydratase n=1 Tax=Streptomyces sp. NPDC002668 TaxID=3154422 RepID=UPI00331A9847